MHSNLYFGRYSIGWHLSNEKGFGRRPSVYVEIAAQAVSEHPWTGCGWNSVPAAYGQAQEDYFATGNYSATEELVAGSSEYCFNRITCK